MDREQILAATRNVLETRAHGVIAVYLFGSVARGSAGPRSDVDLGLVLAERREPGLAGLGFDLAYELELALKRRVDVVVLNDASADLVHRVLRDGILVLEGDRAARVAFEVRSRAQYFDLAPLRSAYRRIPSSGGKERKG